MSKKNTNIVLIGPPGAGKGTQSENMIYHFDYTHISPGILFRKHVEYQTDLGKKIQEPMAKGNLLNDQLVIEIIQKTIQGIPFRNGFLFDGFPRTIAQAKALDTLMKVAKEKIDFVIILDVSEEEIQRRLKERSLKHQRPDDQNEAKVKARIHSYYENLPDILNFYSEKIKKIDANHDRASVFQLIKNAMDIAQ